MRSLGCFAYALGTDLLWGQCMCFVVRGSTYGAILRESPKPIEVSDMKGRLIVAVLATAFPVALLAQDSGKYQCAHGDLVRRVEIYAEPGVTVPCEVHYYKDTEAPGESQVLWSAQSQAGYCEQKAAEFVAKLEDWGWACGASDASASEPAAEPEEAVEPEVLVGVRVPA